MTVHFFRLFKTLWLRNNFSTAVSQFIDSFLFITIAFYGVMPIWPLIFGQWVIKFAIAVMDTPLIYLSVWFIRERVGITVEKGMEPVS